jgi:hypothetical protein
MLHTLVLVTDNPAELVAWWRAWSMWLPSQRQGLPMRSGVAASMLPIIHSSCFLLRMLHA